jgi:type IV pilus assembly protein PilX
VEPGNVTIQFPMSKSIARESGLVLVITLIVLVAMTLASVALMRSVDTSILATGNFTFKQQAMAAPDMAIERAVLAVIGDGATPKLVADPTANDLAQNYYATIQPGETDAANVVVGFPNAIPTVLRDVATDYPTTFRTITMTGTNDTVRYVIERQCTATGPASIATCNMARGGIASPGGTTHDENVAVKERTTYRVTVRVDGPRNTISFAQAVLR